jgi:hypothetical protein
MLMSMQPSSSAAHSTTFRNFAGILTDIAAKEKKPPTGDMDFLEEDVACLSYEQALRSRTRFNSPPPSTEPRPCSDAVAPKPQRLSNPESEIHDGLKPSASLAAVPSPNRSDRRCSSVTVRLSARESEQLHLRAGEAGLTVSAYLRSCAFEVESLRAEVKSTLAQLRPAVEINPESVQPVTRRSWPRFFTRLSRSEPRL